METLTEYFTPVRIIALLCKYRVKAAKQRHLFHQDLKISHNDAARQKLDKLNFDWKEISEMMPPRRGWVKLTLDERKKHNNSNTSSVDRLKRTIAKVHIDVLHEIIIPPDWYRKLQGFIEEIQASIEVESDYSISKPGIIPEFKEQKGDKTIFRPLTNYLLKDRVILSLSAKYLTDIFDPFFIDESSFAFRSVKNLSKENIKNHHRAIRAIKLYRETYLDHEIWIAECDIKKFFDCVSHKIAIDAFERFCNNLDDNVDVRAKRIFYSYLNSYSFVKSVYHLSSSDFFIKYSLSNDFNNCIFEWPENELSQLYGDSFDTEKYNIGVPQGGAISCLIANMVMHFVDEKVVDTSDKIKYIRYCDDMLILANSQIVCQEALTRYTKAIENSKLIVHPPALTEQYSEKFWGRANKSKLPYSWAKRNAHRGVPWLSFVGYQIRHDGLVRIRPASIAKEVEKQKKFVSRQINVLHNKARNAIPQDVNKVSKKSLNQQVYVLESHLISMSVGRVALKRITKPTLCWANGFFEISGNAIAEKQLRHLDKMRNKEILRFKKRLCSLERESYKPEIKVKKFRGGPFSYFGVLHRPPVRRSL